LSHRSYHLDLEPLEDRTTPAAVGALDPSFGSGGRAVVPNDANNENAVAADSLGRVIVVGEVPGPGDLDAAVVRFTADGRPDPAFGDNGLVALDFGGTDSADAVAVDGADDIIIAGIADHLPGGQSEFVVARLTPDGRLDPAFGTGGKVVFNLPGGRGAASGVAIDPSDGGIVVAGTYAPRHWRALAVRGSTTHPSRRVRLGVRRRGEVTLHRHPRARRVRQRRGHRRGRADRRRRQRVGSDLPSHHPDLRLRGRPAHPGRRVR
jgi:uncharacterized delta-60 repeat protein